MIQRRTFTARHRPSRWQCRRACVRPEPAIDRVQAHPCPARQHHAQRLVLRTRRASAKPASLTPKASQTAHLNLTFPNRPTWALCRLVWIATISFGQRGRSERVSRPMLELGHSPVGDGDEVGRSTEAAGSAFGLLQQAVHGFDECIRAVVGPATHHSVRAFGDGLGQLLERIEPASPGPTQPGACRTWGVDSEKRPQRGRFLLDLQAHSPAMGQKAGEKWTAEAVSQPTIPKPDRRMSKCCLATLLIPPRGAAAKPPWGRS